MTERGSGFCVQPAKPTDAQVQSAVNSYLEENPPSGATAEQEAQMEQNRLDIISLTAENAGLKECIDQHESAIYSVAPSKNLYSTSCAKAKLNVYDTTTFSAATSLTGVVIPIDAGKGIITILRDHVGTRFRAGTSVEYPAAGVSVSAYIGYDNGKQMTITPGSNDNYLYIVYSSSSLDTLTETELLAGLTVFYGTKWTDGVIKSDTFADDISALQKTAIGSPISIVRTDKASRTDEYLIAVTSGTRYYIIISDYDGAAMDYVDVYTRQGSTNVAFETRMTAVGTLYSFYASGDADRLAIYSHLTEAETSTMNIILYTTSEKKTSDTDVALQDFGNILFIGDSYTADSYEGNTAGWINALADLCTFTRKRLGVGSATIKDKYSDRAAYPYTDRPVQASDSGNLNTFACQIAKLKRLIAGTDLDSGESQYTAIPDIIFIQGGMNDGADTDEKVAAYESQFYVAQSAYYATSADGTVAQGTVYVKPDIESVNRTGFAGALRYLYEELHSLYPDAKIYVITPSQLSYGTGNNIKALTKTEQIKKACAYLSIPVIDWAADTGINYLDDYMDGSGTEDDPYIIRGEKEFSIDTLHPNEAGAVRLATAVYNRLRYDFENRFFSG